MGGGRVEVAALDFDGGLTFAYDPNDNRTSVGYPGSVTATFTHDFADREETLTVVVSRAPSAAYTQES